MATFTPEGFAAALERFGKSIHRPIINGARAGLRRAERMAEGVFKSRGLGRTIFGRAEQQWRAAGIKGKRDGAADLIGVQRMAVQRGRVQGGLYAVGLAALQEEGGRIKPHKIPRAGAARVMPVGRHGVVTVLGARGFRVSHPGGPVDRVPALEPALRANAGVIASEIGTRMQTFIDQAGLG